MQIKNKTLAIMIATLLIISMSTSIMLITAPASLCNSPIFQRLQLALIWAGAGISVTRLQGSAISRRVRIPIIHMPPRDLTW